MGESLKTSRIILASQSPRRRLLLKQIGIQFKAHPSHIPEEFDSHETPSENARRISLEKALEVGKQYHRGVVLAADTIVVLGKQMLGKPTSPADARRMLGLLSGKVHTVITAFSLLDCGTGRHVTRVERTKVKFRKIEASEIRMYVASGSPMDKAGGYGIQDDYGAVFVESVHGCFYNVVGFPLARFYVTFKEFRKSLQRRHLRSA